MYIHYDNYPNTALFFDPSTDAGKLIAGRTYITPTGDAILDATGLTGDVVLHPSYGSWECEVGTGHVIPESDESTEPYFDVLSTSFPDGSYLYRVGIIGETDVAAVYATVGRVTKLEDAYEATRIDVRYGGAEPITQEERGVYEDTLALVTTWFESTLPEGCIKFSEGLKMLNEHPPEDMVGSLFGHRASGITIN